MSLIFSVPLIDIAYYFPDSIDRESEYHSSPDLRSHSPENFVFIVRSYVPVSYTASCSQRPVKGEDILLGKRAICHFTVRIIVAMRGVLVDMRKPTVLGVTLSDREEHAGEKVA